MNNAHEQPAPSLPRPIATIGSWVYGGVVSLRNRRFDHRQAAKVDVPVISVGNIVAGGTGKSPMVAWLVHRLCSMGFSPAVALRGYGSDSHGSSDEAMEHELVLPSIPIIVHPDRHAAISRHLAGDTNVDVVVLDDGFQHRRIHRDLDLVLVDATRPCLDDRLLPAGWLREPAGSLGRADGVIITHADAVGTEQLDHLQQRIIAITGKRPIARARHVWQGIDLHEVDGSMRREELARLDGMTVGTILGVGRPASVRIQAEHSGATVVWDVPVKDHQVYDRDLLSRIARMEPVDAVMMTRKDWVKVHALGGAAAIGRSVVVPDLAMELTSDFGLEDALQKVRQIK